ncbi:hypothetical protein [Streptomyces sp. NPDC055105]|uniref:hypothetical protein n=1 Tax=Streptomyces sp. NPDC055105 TaxID=3365719 RepID=UPI0037D97903
MSTATSFAEKIARSRWKARRQQLIEAGQWMPFVAAEPVRDHVNELRAAGMPLRALEARLGLTPHHLDHLLWGSDGSGPGEKVRTETAKTLLAYWPTLDDFPDAARIDATGTRRRCQALQARGFNRIAIAGQAGMATRYFQKAVVGDKVTARLARSVRDVYGLWWSADPCDHGVREWVADRTRREAVRFGWHGPLAWDDDSIDDPQARPYVPSEEEALAEDFIDPVAVGQFVAGRLFTVNDAELLEAVRECRAAGLSNPDIDTLHGVAERTTERALNRIKKAYTRAGRTFPELGSTAIQAQFTAEQVVKIREQYAAYGGTDLELSLQHGVTRAAMSALLSGRTYPNAGGPIRETRSAKPAESTKELWALKTPASTKTFAQAS